jgi:hypothetical protein
MDLAVLLRLHSSSKLQTAMAEVAEQSPRNVRLPWTSALAWPRLFLNLWVKNSLLHCRHQKVRQEFVP